MTLNNGNKKETINFDKKMSLKSEKSKMGRNIVKNLQLNNFCNATKVAYLDQHSTNFFGTVKWKTRLFVLSNVGLLYFDDPLQPPQDLFPVIDCEVRELQPGEIGNEPFVFELRYTRKKIMLKCSTKGERASWISII